MCLAHGSICQHTEGTSGPVQVVPCVIISRGETWGDKETQGRKSATLRACKDSEKQRKAHGDTT